MVELRDDALDSSNLRVEELEPRDPASFFISQSMFQDASSVAEQSLHTQSSVATSATAATSTSRASTIGERPQIVRQQTERSAAAEKSILSRVKRNYIYFSSLLQEPEAKWKQSMRHHEFQSCTDPDTFV